MRRPLKQEHLPQPSLLSFKKKEDKPSFFKKKATSSQILSSIEKTKQRSLNILNQLSEWINNRQEHPMAASKAFELAKQKIDGKMTNQSNILDFFEQVKETICSTSYQQEGYKGIVLGSDFDQLSPQQKIYRLLERSIRYKGAPLRGGSTTSGKEFIDLCQAWTAYLLDLYELLPQKKPLLITGTTGFSRQKGKEPGESEEIEVSGVRNVLQRIRLLKARGEDGKIELQQKENRDDDSAKASNEIQKKSHSFKNSLARIFRRENKDESE